MIFEGIPVRLVPAGDRRSEYQQDLFLDKFIFKGLRNGFFIEAGADDFMLASNSLYFEEKYNWTGLLVEPVPFRFKLGYKSRIISQSQFTVTILFTDCQQTEELGPLPSVSPP